MIKAYKYRIYPKPHQAAMIDKTISACRFVYNLALETKIRAYADYGVRLTAYDLMRQLTELKEDLTWLNEVDSQALQWVIKSIDRSFVIFFNGSGFPRFKRKKNGGSFHCPKNTRRINFVSKKLDIPKIFNIPIEISRPFEGNIRIVTISKTPSEKYFASIVVEMDAVKPTPKPVESKTTIGIDLGIKSLAFTSIGRSFEPNKKLKESLRRLQCLQRRASRKIKGSNNRKKANKCVAILHEKITNKRTDYIHKTTSFLVKGDNQTFVIEDLNVAGMLKNRSLSQTISDAGWGEFRRKMEYKCKWYGKNLIVIDRFEPTSKMCSACGEVNQELTLSDRKWTCSCGVTHDRDHNAAINIKNAGLKQYAGAGSSGEPVESRRLRRAKKQELVVTEQMPTS